MAWQHQPVRVYHHILLYEIKFLKARNNDSDIFQTK